VREANRLAESKDRYHQWIPTGMGFFWVSIKGVDEHEETPGTEPGGAARDPLGFARGRLFDYDKRRAGSLNDPNYFTAP
jgi:hypothetical protein